MRDGWNKIIVHQLDARTRPCNLVEIMPRLMERSDLTHFDGDGRSRMIDVSGKSVTQRRAIARGQVRMQPATLQQVMDGGAAKGDVIAVAELAGIMAARRTGDLIPLCHPLGLDAAGVRIAPDPELPGLVVTAEVLSTGRTGIEMAAMLGRETSLPLLPAMLAAPMPEGGPRETWWRASAAIDATGRLVVTSDPRRDSSLQRPLAEANALIRRPSGALASGAGELVDITLIAAIRLRSA